MRAALTFVKENLKYPLVVAEIGVGDGRHAKEIYDNLNIKRLVLIDIWKIYFLESKQFHVDYRRFEGITRETFAGITNVEIIKADSLEVINNFEDNSFDFIYIDASHDYKEVKKDIACWYPKVKSGGVLAGHDYIEEWAGTVKAVDEFIANSNLTLNFSRNYENGKPDNNFDWWVIKK